MRAIWGVRSISAATARRAPHAPGLQDQGEREEEGHGAFEPLADGDRSQNGDDHEQVHVGAQTAQREPGLQQDGPYPGEDGDAVQDPGHEGNGVLVLAHAASRRLRLAWRRSCI